jgi:hypothetical protein
MKTVSILDTIEPPKPAAAAPGTPVLKPDGTPMVYLKEWNEPCSGLRNRVPFTRRDAQRAISRSLKK